MLLFFFFFKQKTAYELRISDWSSDVCSSDLVIEVLNALDAVVECDRVTGDDCFIAKAHVSSIEELEAVIDRLVPYAVTNSSIIQSSPVKRRMPPLPHPPG